MPAAPAERWQQATGLAKPSFSVSTGSNFPSQRPSSAASMMRTALLHALRYRKVFSKKSGYRFNIGTNAFL
jgi:hypothetical protein